MAQKNLHWLVLFVLVGLLLPSAAVVAQENVAEQWVVRDDEENDAGGCEIAVDSVGNVYVNGLKYQGRDVLSTQTTQVTSTYTGSLTGSPYVLTGTSTGYWQSAVAPEGEDSYVPACSAIQDERWVFHDYNLMVWHYRNHSHTPYLDNCYIPRGRWEFDTPAMYAALGDIEIKSCKLKIEKYQTYGWHRTYQWEETPPPPHWNHADEEFGFSLYITSAPVDRFETWTEDWNDPAWNAATYGVLPATDPNGFSSFELDLPVSVVKSAENTAIGIQWPCVLWATDVYNMDEHAEQGLVDYWGEFLWFDFSDPQVTLEIEYDPIEQYTHRVAYVPVRYIGKPEPTHTIADLRERAQLVADYYRQQSYGEVNLSCEFIYNDWAYLQGCCPPDPYDKDGWRAIRDQAIIDSGIDPSDYDAIIVIQPECIQSFASGKLIITGDKKSYATWAHEIGHAIPDGLRRKGFWDYYDATTKRGDIHNWGLMGLATVMDPTAPIMSYNKVLAKWLTYAPMINKTAYGEYGPIKLLKDMNLGDEVYRYEAGTNADQYYIFEGRQPPDDIAEDTLIPGLGYSCWPHWHNWYVYYLQEDKGVLLYKVTGDEISKKQKVFSVPHPIPFWPDAVNKVTLTPGKTYPDDEAQVKFTALERSGQLYVNISENPLYSRKVFSLFDTSWETPGFPIESEPVPSQWYFDLDLHAYTYDGEEIGMDYTTWEYKNQVGDARTSGNIPGGGPEWISLPEGENIYFIVDPTPAREWADELDVEVENIQAMWQIVYYDEEGTRRESEPITLDISLDEPEVLGLQASIDIDPDTLNLKSKGQWVTCWIELPGGYDVSNIDLSTVTLNYAVPAESDTKYGFVKNPKTKDADEDGLPELMVKFDRAAVQATVQPADSVTISVLGEVTQNDVPVPFKGTDAIRVISPGK